MSVFPTFANFCLFLFQVCTELDENNFLPLREYLKMEIIIKP